MYTTFSEIRNTLRLCLPHS